MARRLLAVVAAFILVIGQAGAALATAGGASGQRAANSAPIDKKLLGDFAKGDQRFIVEFTSKADLRPAAKQKGHAKRGATVYAALNATAKGSQAEALKVARTVKGANPKSYWLTNSLVVTGDEKLARKLAAVKGVSSVHPQKIYPLVKPVEMKTAVVAAVGDPEWGVAKIGADQVWDEGITGAGIVVATIDTGVDFTHPALVNNYRGNNHDGSFSHDYNWWDPSGSCPGEPCDNVGHGTHTMGTIAGGDGPGPFTPDIGVAPGAEWIAAKGCEDFGCSSESLLSSGQFVIAPTDMTGANPDPSLAPDLVSNSWGNDSPDDTFYLETVQAWRAAGIIPVFAAGNAGEGGCGTAGTPGNYNEVISLGATDDTDLIAPFSSRGPSPTGKVSPNLSAPGVEVISSVPGGDYASFSGTSMATPHAAGTIALMLSSKPALLGDFDAVLNALNVTAVDRPDDTCGTPDPTDNDPNYVYGEGRIDAKAAVDLVKSGGTLSGTVTGSATLQPIGGARVVANNGERDFAATADSDGNYSLFLGAGTYAVTASAFGYASAITPGVVIVTDGTTDQDFALVALPRFHVNGHVTASEDGSPIEGASILAIGTPVPAARTDAAGAYSLELPIGDYTLRASAGGCTEVATADVSLTDADITQDFSLFRKLDDFGHGCRAIPFDWVDATTQSALYGDEFAGRLSLPFAFDFYGATYTQVFLSDNGYLNFLAGEVGNNFPQSIPSAAPPNAAIYALWQDLSVDAASSIDYGTVGDSPNRAFVIEYSGMKVAGASGRVSFEIKLWEDGRIDLLYGDNPASPGDGRNATIGIENATGTDALQFSFFEGLLGPNSAYRYEHVPSGLVHGVVTDANDDLPIGGATLTATPGGRTTTTGGDGTYTLRLRPGSYQLGASATNYVSASVPLTIADGGDETRDFALAASAASVQPPEVNASVDFGATTTAPLTLSNDGSAPLEWTALERDQGVIAPPLPEVTSTVIRKATWARQPIPANFPRVKIAAAPGVLSTIITDPAGDSLDLNDVTTVRAGSDGTSVASMAIDFAPTTEMDAIGGYVYFDTDQDPSTGLPAEALFGKPTQDIGMEYFADLFEANGPEPFVPIYSADTFELVAVLPATIDGQSIVFDIPLEALGGDDGFINTGMVVGLAGPSDWAPDNGHGTIEPFTDALWLSETPDSGTIAAGESDVITLHLGTADLPPGEYHALVVFVTNAPKQTQLAVPVTLTVNLPPEFGAIKGTVTDAHTGDPLGGVAVVVHTTWQGNLLTLKATTAADGTYGLTGPSGTWPADFTLDGYVTEVHNVTIVAGVTTPGVDAQLHRRQPHAALDGGPFTFILTPGRTGHGTLTLSNPGGHEDLTFDVKERSGDTTGVAARPAAPIKPSGRSSTSSHARPARFAPSLVKPSITGQPSLVLMDVLPWDSDAIQQTLTANGVAFDVAGSADIGSLDFTTYHAIYVGNDQPQAFYDAYLANADKFASYVTAGGFLWFGSAAFGFQDGNPDGVALPGGLVIHGPTYEDDNGVDAPGNPLAAGLPDPFSGTSASHVTFSDLPSGAIVVAHGVGSGEPTLVDYDFGGGHVVAVGQPVEYGFAAGQDTALILQNGVPYAEAFQPLSDVPWLSEAPTSGSIAPDGSTDIDVTVDTTGLAPGVYHADVVILTNDPDHAAFSVPVLLVVPAYQQGVDAGTGTYVDPANGNVFASDRAFSAGSFGYVGASSVRSTGTDIAGTDRDPLYQDLRTGMSAYRFSVPNGTYRVDLSFAELQLKKAGARVFSISLEGSSALANLDVFAAAGGRYVALDRSFVVEVSDGVLDISFAAQRGDSPIVNAILVTEMPPGSPGP
jgi:subtilisin family serine protease